MNLISVANDLKGLSDQQLQQQLLQPNGMAPSFVVLSELQRRKEARNDYSARAAGGPQPSMAEEYAQGIGGQSDSPYANAVKQGEGAPGAGAAPPTGQPPQGMNDPMQTMGPMGAPMGGQPPQQPQGFAGGGLVGPINRDFLSPQAASPMTIPTGAPPPPQQGWAEWPLKPMAPPAAAAPKGLGILAQSMSGDPGMSMGLGGAATGDAGSGQGGNAANGDGSSGGSAAAGTSADGGSGTYAGGGGVDDLPPALKALFERAMGTSAAGAGAGGSSNGGGGGGSYMGLGGSLGSWPSQFQSLFPGVSPNAKPTFYAGGGGIPWPTNELTDLGFQREPLGRPPPRVLPTETLGDPMGSGVPDAQSQPLGPAIKYGLGKVFPPTGPTMVGSGGYGGPDATLPPPIPEQTGGQGYGGPDPMGGGLGALAGAGGNGLAALSDPSGGPAGPAGAGGAGGGGGGGRPGTGGGATGRGQTLADYYKGIQDIKLPDRYGELAAQNAQDKAELRTQADDNKGLALLQTGLAIAAGRSPNAITNIGEGGMQGAKFWQDAQKEMRQAQRDVRNADQAIAIAQANRDERGLENAIKVKAHAEDLDARAQDRASAAGIAAAARSQALELKKMEIDDSAKNRLEAQEQHRLNGYQTTAKTLGGEANVLQTKLLSLKSTGMETPEEKQRLDMEVAQTRQLLNQRLTETNEANTMLRRGTLERELRLGNVVMADPKREGFTIEGKRMKKGQRFMTHDYRTGTYQSSDE